ncbi:unnamed protein product [Cercopithifilaria johnstoni]|uniref:Uncharacterized protein n=1 Tax=Cercopithifilaria johnstoni TaxID=2874296 RepID=A0A8J2M3Q5_9BILA|nr:unnamed protein product [Cercopithifilaria johnstoni]
MDIVIILYAVGRHLLKIAKDYSSFRILWVLSVHLQVRSRQVELGIGIASERCCALVSSVESTNFIDRLTVLVRCSRVEAVWIVSSVNGRGHCYWSADEMSLVMSHV